MLGGALAGLVAGCMPGLNRPAPGDDLRVDAAGDRSDLEEPDDWGVVDQIVDVHQPDARPPDRSLPDANVGHWYQADQKNCASHCTSLSRTNVPSPEQALCMSGEVRPESGIDQGIKFTWGCVGGCAAQSPPLPSKSYGTDCYKTGQKQDGDDTDRTVGCFCK